MEAYIVLIVGIVAIGCTVFMGYKSIKKISKK